MNKTTNKPRVLHYVPSSHWDREWYQPFQDYRHKLVALMDTVLEELDSGTLQGPFTGDGQFILLEDYLEIRPEKESEVRKRIKEGRLEMGPWYVLPDEFLVSGESLIRNLELGRRRVREFGGEPSDAGFVCDLFGHNSQIPQLLKGFGIIGALVWRGVDFRQGARFRWRGADGTELPTYRFGKSGYCDYTYKVRHCTDPLIAFDPLRAREDLETFGQEELDRVGGDAPGLIFDGGDHLFPDMRHYGILQEAIHSDRKDWKIVHGTLGGFLREFAETLGEDAVLLEGELREPARWPTSEDQQFLIPGCLASRVWIKQENAACESLLCQWAEPMAVLATRRTGMEYPQGFLDVAWKWLIQNHPHDSICGCSVDQVHEDMKYRFSQCRQIAERLIEESCAALTAAVPGEVGLNEIRMGLFNPIPRARRGVMEFEVEIPAAWPEFTEFFGYEPKPAFRLFAVDTGEEIPYQRLSTQRNVTRKRIRYLHYPKPYLVHVVRVAAEVTLPALGFAVFKVQGIRPNGNGLDHLGNRHVPSTRYPAAPGLRTGPFEMANSFLHVTLQTNGGLCLKDLRSGNVYANLNLFEDDADIGDGWYHGPSVNRRDILGGGGDVQLELEADTPLLTTFVTRRRLSVPAAYAPGPQRRDEARVDMILESYITLRADADALEIETRITNPAGDHRLRVIFPTAAHAVTYLADSAFDVVERPIALHRENHLYRELEVETKPQQSWTAVCDGSRGLAVITAGGLLESTVQDRPDRPIALTLFRSTRRTKMTDGEPEGLLLGRTMSFRYRLLPLQGEPDRIRLFDHARELSGGLRSAYLSAEDLAFERSKPERRASAADGLLALKGRAVLSSVRMCGEEMEVRVFNPETTLQTLELHPGGSKWPGVPRSVDFEGREKQARINTCGRFFQCALGKKEILTMRIQ